MIYIVSPHLGNSWRKVQRLFVSKYTPGSHKLIQVDVPDGMRHIKALRVCMKYLEHCAKVGDLCVLLDSDAFPVSGKWVKTCLRYLRAKKYVAVQRLEAEDARHLAHPCFVCWPHGREISWSYHGPAKNPHVRGSEDQSIWKGIHKSNEKSLHSRLYTVYGDMIYHHGAGSRDVSMEGKFRRGLQYNNDFWADPQKFIRKLRGK